jgi:hypothetical protein
MFVSRSPLAVFGGTSAQAANAASDRNTACRKRRSALGGATSVRRSANSPAGVP